MPGPVGPICPGPARYERMLPVAARPASRSPGAVVPDVRATRAGQDLARLDLPPVSLASERRPSAPSAHVLPAHVLRGGRCGRAGRTRELLRRDAVCRWRRPRRGGDPGRCCARCLRRHTRRGDVRGGARERQVPRAAQEPPAVQPPGAALVPDVRRAARRAALLSLKWPPCRRQGQEALRCVCLIAT